MKKEIITIKYPLRYLEQIIILGLIIYFIINYKVTFNNSIYSLIFVILCITELFSIIYLLRNKTYYYVDKADYKYLIKRKDLDSKEEREDSNGFIIDHYRYNDKVIDILNGNPNSLRRAKASSSVLAEVTNVTFIPMIL